VSKSDVKVENTLSLDEDTYYTMTKTIFTIIAVVAFVLATFGATISHVALIPLGLAFFAARELVK